MCNCIKNETFIFCPLCGIELKSNSVIKTEGIEQNFWEFFPKVVQERG